MKAEKAVIVSSGRGVHEALAASDECAREGISLGVVDMPSIDETLLRDLCKSGKLVCIAEQNNGYILQNLLKVAFRQKQEEMTLLNVMAVNTLDAKGRPQFIHSGTYEELTAAFDLTGVQLAASIKARLAQ